MRALLLTWSVLWSMNAAVAALDPISLAEDERNFAAPALIEGAISPDAKLRARVADALGRIRKAETIDPLLKLAADPDKSVVRAALFSLGQLGWSRETANSREKEISDAIARHLKDTDLTVRRAAVEATGKLFHAGTEAALFSLLSDPYPSVRAQVLSSLYQMRNVVRNRAEPADALQPYSDENLGRVMRLLNMDKDEVVREKAAYLLARLKDKRSWNSMLMGSRDKKLWVRYFSTIAIGDTSDPADVDTYRALVRLSSDDSYLVRTEALRTAAKLSLIRKLHDFTYVRLAKDPSHHVRGALVDSMKNEASIQDAHIEYFLKDKSRMVRAKAVVAMATRKKDNAVLMLESAMLDPDYWVRAQAVVAAAASLDAHQEAFLLKAVRDPAPQVALEAIGALGKLKSEAAVAAVNEASKSPELSVRYQAMFGISNREDASKLTLAWEVYSNSQERKWIDLRQEIVGVLASAKNDEDRTFVEEKLRTIMTNDPSPVVAYAAFEALKTRSAANLPTMEAPKPERMPESETVYARNPILTLETTKGKVTIELYADRAPLHAASVAGFAEKGGYNGLPWHRVETNFVVQGGDPDKTGYSSGDYPIRHEVNSTRYIRGTLGMPRAAHWDSGGIQLFITHVPTPNLDGLYTVFGQVTAGMEIVDRLEQGDLILKASVKK